MLSRRAILIESQQETKTSINNRPPLNDIRLFLFHSVETMEAFYFLFVVYIVIYNKIKSKLSIQH